MRCFCLEALIVHEVRRDNANADAKGKGYWKKKGDLKAKIQSRRGMWSPWLSGGRVALMGFQDLGNFLAVDSEKWKTNKK